MPVHRQHGPRAGGPGVAHVPVETARALHDFGAVAAGNLDQHLSEQTDPPPGLPRGGSQRKVAKRSPLDWSNFELFSLAGDPVTSGELGLFALSLLAAVAVAWGLGWLLCRRLTFLEPADRNTASRLLFWIFLVFGVLAGLETLGVPVSRPALLEFSPVGIATFVTLLVTVVFGSYLVRKTAEQKLLVKTGLDPGARYAVARILYYVLLGVGLMATLQTTGLQLSSLTVAVGALSVGIGFGLQNIVNNFVSGLILLLERPIQVGDWIEVEGTSGRITQIGARSVTVLTNDNISILVPNADFLSNQVINWSHGTPEVRIRLPIGVAYGTDLDHATAALLRVAKESPHVLDKPEPSVLVDSFGDSSVDLELAVWIDIRSAALRRVRSDLNRDMYREFRESGVEIPFPQRDVHLKSG